MLERLKVRKIFSKENCLICISSEIEQNSYLILTYAALANCLALKDGK
jgi:hypothetical protein